jgi:nucleoside-diphosphate-sugar epimerase
MTIKIGLTGSSGLIGTKFLEKFEKKYTFHKFVGDMTNIDHINQFMKEDFDVVIHLASIIPKYDKSGIPLKQSFSDNVIGTENICKMVLQYKKKLIFASTQRVYKIKNNASINETDRLEPDTDYGKSKLESEQKIQQYLSSENFTILRISNIYGTYPIRSSIIDSIAESSLKNEPLHIGLHPETIRDYIHIEDVLDAFELSISKNGIFNICYGHSFSIKEIIKVFENSFGMIPKVTFGNYKPGNIFLENNKAINELNFKPNIEFSKGIFLTINMIKKFLT